MRTMPDNQFPDEEQQLSPILAKRFLRAFIRAAHTQAREHGRQGRPHGLHVAEASQHIHTFQRDILRGAPPPRLLRQELNELQRRVNLALNQEKYISTIQEQESRAIAGMEPPFHTARPTHLHTARPHIAQCVPHRQSPSVHASFSPSSRSSSASSMPSSSSIKPDFPTPAVPVQFPLPLPAPSASVPTASVSAVHTPALPVPVPAQLPVLPQKSFHARMIEQVEQQILAVQEHAARLKKQKQKPADASQLARIEKLVRQYQRRIQQLKKKHSAG